MTDLDEQIKDFFEQKVFDLDEDDIDKYLKQYPPKQVIQYLVEKIKYIASSSDNAEPAWHLGRVFACLDEKYSADIEVYSWFNTFNNLEKIALLNFLSGYWDGTKPDIKTVTALATVIEKSILDKLEDSEELIFWGIEATVTGYSRYELDADMDNILKEKFKFFETYLLTFSLHNSYTERILNFIQSLLNK
jgi:hypothetical protein